MPDISPQMQADTDQETTKPPMLEIGEFCSYCGFRDFLPFACSGCDGNFCAEHREKDLHKCPNSKTPSGHDPALSRPPQKAAFSAVKASSRSQGRPQRPQQPLAKPKPASDPGHRLGGSAQTASPGLKPSGLSALNRLRDMFADRRSARVQDDRTARPDKGVVAKAHERAAAAANATKVAGDSRIPVAERCYVVLRRPASRYTDPITKAETTRPAKAIDTFFSQKQRVGQVSDAASALLGASVKSLAVDGDVLDPGLPINAVPPGKIIDALTA